MGRLANLRREQLNGNNTYFIHNRHINPTNICIHSCQFCAFGVKADAPNAYEKSLDEIFEDAGAYRGGEVSEFHIVGGLHPDWPYQVYLDMVKGLKDRFPRSSYSGVHRGGVALPGRTGGQAVARNLLELREAGLGSIPGGGAEIFASRCRKKICNDKITGEEWLEVHEIAHEVGLKSNATMLYGHLETIEERVDHLVRLGELQDRTGGFVTFIPLSFHPENTPLEFLPSTSGQLDLRALAVSRLMLDNFPHVKAFWIMITPKSRRCLWPWVSMTWMARWWRRRSFMPPEPAPTRYSTGKPSWI